MKVGIIASTLLELSKDTKKGTEIFVYKLIKALAQYSSLNFSFTVFASGDSQVPYLNYIQKKASLNDYAIKHKYHHLFESAHISHALSQSDIDLLHVNISNGEMILPFARFVHKPILVTTHYHLEKPYRRKLFDYYRKLDNVYFVTISNFQRNPLPKLNYSKTIYHGIDLKMFKYSDRPTADIMWAGRGEKQKGLGTVLDLIKKIKVNARLFPLIKDSQIVWYDRQIVKKERLGPEIKVYLKTDVERRKLVKYYQISKLFLNPIKWEEPFGLVMIEAMACGTPVVAYARGSVPEIIKDGETGFIVNSSPKNIRGKWIVKKTGIEGLIEAVERIYSMPDKEYRQMRLNCRRHVEKHFAIERMVNEYIQVYKEVVADYQKKRSKLG